MRNALGVLAVAAASALLGCAAPAEVTTATLALHSLPSCDVAPPKQLRLRASGDFPAIDVKRDSVRDASITLDEFPIDTDYVAFEAGSGKASAGGLTLLLAGQGDLARSVLLLPYGTSCPLGDPLATAAPGAALAALPDGGLLIAGGSGEDGMPVASARVLPPGEALVQEIAGGMLFRRAGASATLAGDRVVVAGGGQDDGRGALANDSFEIYDVASGVFDKLQSDHLVESHARRDHGSALLGNGRVLLAGGCNRLGMTAPADVSSDVPRCTATGAEPLANAEWIDPSSGKSIAIKGVMNVARVAPRVLVLDSGAVLIALGWDEAGQLVPEVERFQPDTGTFHDIGVRLPVNASAAVTALEGERVLYAGCDANADCELALLVPDATRGFARVDLPKELGSSARLHGLDHLRLLPLHDGRVLLAARETSTGMRMGFVIDLNAVKVDPADLTRVPDQLLELADGTRVEADSEGISLARQDAQSPLDDAPEPVVSDKAQHLTLDVATRWRHDDNGLAASHEEARADLPFLRFADVRIELVLESSATGTLLLERAAAAPVEIELGQDTIGFGSCKLARARDAKVPISIERHAGALTLHSGSQDKACDAPQLARDRIGIAIRLAAESRLSSLRVTRL